MPANVDPRVIRKGPRASADAPHGKDPRPRKEGNEHHADGTALGNAATMPLRIAEARGEAEPKREAIH
eukprot:6854940-Lingulodinium_polyedra.AAC.1